MKTLFLIFTEVFSELRKRDNKALEFSCIWNPLNCFNDYCFKVRTLDSNDAKMMLADAKLMLTEAK